MASARASLPPVAAAGNTQQLAAEINSLSAEHTLVTNGPLRVLLARAAEIPRAFLEIARLRELTFRAVGEGSGKPLDMDRFDPHYLHLFIWNDDKQEIAGAYRLGCTDRLLSQFGVGGLYTSTVFRFQPRLLHRLNSGLELGRSFVCAEYQRSFSALMLLWKGIGRFLVQNPRYRFLFGPVSISNEYQPFSQHLMVEFLRKKHALPHLARWVKPRIPFRPHNVRPEDAPSVAAVVDSIDELNTWVTEIEPGSKGVPILLRQYLRLGGKVLAFNVDPNFSHVVDGLILVDVLQTDPVVLERYLGREGVATFRAYHQHALPLSA
jgi:putative hemolysin